MDEEMNARLLCLQLAQKVDETQVAGSDENSLVRIANTFYEFVNKGTVLPADED